MTSFQEYKIVPYSDEYREEWNIYARKKGTVFHLVEWKEILENSFGYKGSYHMVMHEGRIVGLIPFMTGRNVFFSKVGVSLPFVNYLDICYDNIDIFRLIINFVKEFTRVNSLKYSEIRLKDETIDDEEFSVNDRNYTFIIPLLDDEDRVKAGFSPNTRNHINKVIKRNVFYADYSFDRLKEFYNVYSIRQKQLGTPTFRLGFLEEITNKLPENTVLLTVIDNETQKVVGGMFLFTFNDIIYYQWGGNLIEYNRMNINEFMYWEAVKYGIANGFRYLDLGRAPLNAGHYFFKEHWCKNPEQLKYYRYIPASKRMGAIETDKLSIFAPLWSKMPSFLTRLTGNMLIKRLMP